MLGILPGNSPAVAILNVGPTFVTVTFDNTTKILTAQTSETGTLHVAVGPTGTSWTGAGMKAGTEGYEALTSTAVTSSQVDTVRDVTTTSPDGTRELAVVLEDGSGAFSNVATFVITVDNTAPAFASSFPADGATGAPTSGNITITFDDVILQFGSSGNFTLRDVTGSTDEEVFDVATGLGDNGGTISIDATTVILAPGAARATSNDYSVRWTSGAIEDGQGNGVAANTGDTLVNFTTEATGQDVQAGDGLIAVNTYTRQSYTATAGDGLITIGTS